MTLTSLAWNGKAIARSVSTGEDGSGWERTRVKENACPYIKAWSMGQQSGKGLEFVNNTDLGFRRDFIT